MTTGVRVPGQRLRGDQYMCSRCGIIHACKWDNKPRTCLACTLPAEREAGFPDQAWAADALCAQVGSDAFFPELGQRNKAAKAVCAKCPVQVACRAWALAVMPEHGVWGGLSAHERKHLTGEVGAA